MSVVAAHLPQAAPQPPPAPGLNYLNVAYGWRSWLLTRDHKRIAILYLISITLMFFIGGAAVTIIRLHLLTPNRQPDEGLVTADQYNRLFSIHGIIMVIFFLVPDIQAALGNVFVLMLIVG